MDVVFKDRVLPFTTVRMLVNRQPTLTLDRRAILTPPEHRLA
jgi:hypothetical protein